MSWPLSLSRSFYRLCLAKGVFSPVLHYCGYLNPSLFFVIIVGFRYWQSDLQLIHTESVHKRLHNKTGHRHGHTTIMFIYLVYLINLSYICCTSNRLSTLQDIMVLWVNAPINTGPNWELSIQAWWEKHIRCV